ncbi:extracellular elastinolytic metalloproteinase [Coprinopsis cinerea AmutBmut pab1-1]|nr:extracellular elastinolytic metalloproteinase [Coprinopsis cinerea AmutBmut pab1-1]
MARLQSLLSTILVAISLVGPSIAAPNPSADFDISTRATVRVGRRQLPVEAFHPASTYETYGEGLSQPEPLVPVDLPTEAREFVAEKLNIDRESVDYRSGFASNGRRHAYLRQRRNGINFANAVANVAFKDNKVVSFGSSFVNPNRVAPPTPSIQVESVIPTIEEALDGKYNGRPTRLEYLARPDGSASLTFAIQIENLEQNTWYEAFVDAQNGELLSVVDFTADAAYRVLRIQNQAFPDGVELLVDPEDTTSSPLGWHTFENGTTTTTTSGNNVVSFKDNQDTGLTSESSPGVFDYTYDDTLAPAVLSNVDAARTNAFYVVNAIHDFAYRYGFTEAAFNFQQDNFGKGGVGNDRVTISVQDASGTNNANFATPPDGQSGRCRMYIWTTTSPNRDGSLQNDIIVHEVAHGISNRLTGGGTASCLQTTESRGLGEGWSDALAEWTQQKSEQVNDYVLAAYVFNNPGGIRSFPYSTSNVTNPSTYANVQGQFSVHRIGEIWANILHNVYAALVGQYGWSPAARTNPDGLEGNIVWLHLFMDGLALQPCNPTFVAARDSWIQADANRYDGANRCLLWRVFASRGLGLNARAASYVNNFDVPEDCVE